ncbi:MAG TPA: ABC transporter permease, partial [Thermoanaerobaculia bacterium]|nr:ABC transporter permease [Thermoanaerobaculia bacterium]
ELFIIAEVMLAVPLLIGAAVTVKRFQQLQSVDIGFDPDHVITGQIQMPPRYAGRPERTRFAAELLRRLDATPGIESAAITTSTFRYDESPGTVIETERSHGENYSINFRRITPRYFATMKIRLIAGRNFSENDTLDSPPVVIVSQSLARQFFPGENAIGKKLRRTTAGGWVTIVGIAPDIRDSGVSLDLGPLLYAPFLQNNGIFVSLVARTHGDPATLAMPLQRAVWSIDRGLAVSDTIPLRTLVDGTLSSERLQVSLLGAFALIAMLLAAAGIYSVTSYAVSQRMREAGVRMAFGATPGVIVRELLQRATRSVSIGLAAGLALAFAATRLLPNAAGHFDPAYAAVVVLVLLASSLVASFVPALRARTASPNLLLLRDA